VIKFNLFEAKTQLSRLVDRAAAGEEIVIAKNGRPMARLVPLAHDRPPRRPGRGIGKIEVGPNFDDPLPAELRAAFGTEP
jgi:prevent-host-death family protein